MHFFSKCALYGSLLLTTTSAFGRELPPFALMTVPKSGSHLVIKALHFLTGSVPVWHTHFPSVFYIPSEEGFLYTHLCLSEILERNYEELPKLKKIVNIRDLRDVCVSIVHQIRKNFWPGMSLDQRREFLEMSFDDQLLFVIGFDYEIADVAEYAPNSLQTSVVKIAEQAIRYGRDPSYLVCKYENLVGPMGGGTEEDQVAELQRIAFHLGREFPLESLGEIAGQLYGNEVDPFGKGDFKHFTSTFNRGQIGYWKNVFKEEHKIAFKEKLGRALIELGYENDWNW
jgi:hypothetical protein